MWSELLGVSDIGRDDDFFALGGHSLMALRLFSRINREFDRTLPLAALLNHPTIRELAPLVGPAPELESATAPVVPSKGHFVTLNKGDGETPLFCIHGGDGGVLFYRSLVSLMPEKLPIHAIESLELGNSGTIEASSIEDTATSYLRILFAAQPAGPYRLAGYSFGGVVAHEMACQLEKLGQQVEFLGLFDTHNPTASARSYSMPERLRVFWQQNAGVPLWRRIKRVRTRFFEGIQTNRRIKSELKAASASGPAEAYSDLRRVQVREENWRAMQAYQPGPFRGRITLFKTTTISDKVERPPDYGWACVAGEGLDIVPVSGEHLTLFAQENISELAAALTTSIHHHSRSPSH
jgi:thioesterase domain-containing protein/acyl carrier protein